MFKKFSSLTLLRYIESFTKLRFSHTSNSKIVNSLEEAVKGLQTGQKILIGGFGLCGIPENLIKHIVSMRNSIKDLTLVTCSCGNFFIVNKPFTLLFFL